MDYRNTPQFYNYLKLKSILPPSRWKELDELYNEYYKLLKDKEFDKWLA